MTGGKENPQEVAAQKIYLGLTRIADADMGRISEIAARTTQKMRKREILIDTRRESDPSISLTGFGIRTLPISAGQALYAPSLIINSDRVNFVNDPTVRADLVKSITLLDGFPDKGFEQRGVAQYNQALDLQEEWLTAHDATIPDDPRGADREQHIRRLMGDEAYFMDVGFKDWQIAVDRAKRTVTADNARLDELREDPSQFLMQRINLRAMAFDALQTLPGYENFSADQRAFIGAGLFLDNLLHVGRRTNN